MAITHHPKRHNALLCNGRRMRAGKTQMPSLKNKTTSISTRPRKQNEHVNHLNNKIKIKINEDFQAGNESQEWTKYGCTKWKDSRATKELMRLKNVIWLTLKRGNMTLCATESCVKDAKTSWGSTSEYRKRQPEKMNWKKNSPNWTEWTSDLRWCLNCSGPWDPEVSQ